MPKRQFKQVRSVGVAVLSAITAMFLAVSAALASSIGGSFP
jgi:hypothetical protein